MARPKKKKGGGRQRDASLIMFLSLNMILLAFFILLSALAAPNETKEAELAIEVRKAFQSFGGSFLGLGGFAAEQGISREKNPITDTSKVEAYLGELTRFLEENKDTKVISYEVTTEGLIIHISEEFSFRPGSLELLEQGLPIYNNIYNLIAHTTNSVRIEGHTDNVSIRTEAIQDNWELSAKRALVVYRFFTASGELPPSRFRIVGHGSQRPLANNLTQKGRDRNRRVSIVFEGKLERVGEGKR